MYLSKLHLRNWRTYGDVTFDFAEPTARKSVVLVGAMNGHGKTSFLMSLYLGLFGRFGLRHCEGFTNGLDPDVASYRKAVEHYRRDVANPDEPTIIDVTLSPTLTDAEEEEVRVSRRWYFTGQNKTKQGEAFEEVDVYVGGRLQRKSSLDKDPLVVAAERVEKNLFPAHVAPAFFFDGEQAQKLIENSGGNGLKKAVEVMFGTKVIGEVAETVSQYLTRVRQATGGRRRASERQDELDQKVKDRDALNSRIAKLQGDHIRLEREKDEKERERSNLQIQLAQMGGGGPTDLARLQKELERIEHDEKEAGKALSEAVSSLGIALAMSRLSPAIAKQLKAEELREAWENLKRGTLDNKEKVLGYALPEPAETDNLLGHLNAQIRHLVRDRFSDALERIYNPPPPESATKYLLGHVKGDARSKVLVQIDQVQSGISTKAKFAAKKVRDARDSMEDVKARMERVTNLPQQTAEIRKKLDELNTINQELSRKLGYLESEVRKLKADFHTLNEEIGRIQEELARLGPEQKRIAVAERIGRALEALQEQLKPMTTARLEETVTKHFRTIADKRFNHGVIRLPVGPPVDQPAKIELGNQTGLPLESLSGFEKRSFGIGFSLALAEITRRRIPLVIDTPLGNADSEYRPRTLQALTEFDLDQVIILTHDEEVTNKLVESIRPSLLQTFLVEFQDRERGSIVHPNRYF